MQGHRDLKVYQLAYDLAMEIFHLSRSFPREELYSLTDQIRRSSRSVVLLRTSPKAFASDDTRICW